MCGIAGILLQAANPSASVHIKTMTDTLAHRGPDGDGVFVDDYMGLGHRRLAILDISSNGAQPMSSHNEEWVIVFKNDLKLKK